jgi:hypothetical protein
MDLRAEIDRGEVVLARPKLDKDGHKKWHPPVSDRPTLTLYARVGKGEVALGRWPTTIGGWKTIEKSDGSMALKYKESVTGDADLAPGDGHTHAQAAHQAGGHLGAEDRDHRPGLPRGLRTGGSGAPPDRGC